MSRRCSISSSKLTRTLLKICASSWPLTGFKMYSITPSLMACWAYSKSSYPEKIRTFMDGYFSRIRAVSASPSMYGMRMSVIITSGSSCSSFSRASSPFSASPTTSKPSPAQSILRIMALRTSSSSSTSMIRYKLTESPPF